MSGKLVGLILLISTFIGGISLYYLQVYYFYEKIDETSENFKIRVLSKGSDLYETVKVENFNGIDGKNSPLKYKSCFKLSDVERVGSIGVKVLKPIPLTAPAWFSCFNAKKIGLALENGEARAVISEKNIFLGIDRVLAFFNDGSAFAWHQLSKKNVK
tara:strand:+ start:1304 stop:1777 length:474 start_codon:yes stop_codon:yes gene_type:complete